MTLHYKDIFSVFLTKMTDYSFLDYDEDYIESQMTSWLHLAMSYPRIRTKFSFLKIDDEIKNIEYNLKNSVDDVTDIEFAKDVFARFMVIAWLEPQVKNVLLTKQMFTGNEEKFYAQSNHLSQLQNMLSTAKIELDKILRDYGYLNNSYIKE